MKSAKDLTTHELDNILAHRVPWVKGADEEYEKRSFDLNEKLRKDGVLLLTKEEVENGDYKALSPQHNSFNFHPQEGDEWACRVMPLRYWDDESYIRAEMM